MAKRQKPVRGARPSVLNRSAACSVVDKRGRINLGSQKFAEACRAHDNEQMANLWREFHIELK